MGGGNKWKCKEGCDQAKLIRTTGRYCVHLEKLLPATKGPGSRHLSFVPTLDRYAHAPSPEDLIIEQENADQLFRADGEPDPRRSDEDEVAQSERLKALPPRTAALIAARVIRGLSFQEIADELGFSSRKSAQRSFTNAIRKLRGK